jgi:ribosomal protein L30E
VSDEGAEAAFVTSVSEFNPRDDEIMTQDRGEMILPTSSHTMSSKILLDTQAPIHIIAIADFIDNIVTAERSILVQGINKDVTHVTLEGTLRTVGIPVYHSPHVAANILSYAKLQDTHVRTFKAANILSYAKLQDTHVCTFKAANILSYAKLQDTHVCTFKDEVFQATA